MPIRKDLRPVFSEEHVALVNEILPRLDNEWIVDAQSIQTRKRRGWPPGKMAGI